MRLIDAHCHLVDEKLIGDVESILDRAKEKGVEKFVTMAGDRKDWPKLIEISSKHPEVFVAFGWHPEDITKVEKLDDLEKLISENSNCVAIGEIGLDFYYDPEKKTREVQMEMLYKQMELAVKIQKLLVVHVRNAEDEMREVMKEVRGDYKCHFHCFGESEKFLREVLDLGHVVSFGGNVTFKSAENLRSMLRIVPLDRLLLETDSPYLAPEPVRGRLNEPANLAYTAHFIAKELKMGVEELADAAYQNTLCFFGLEN